MRVYIKQQQRRVGFWILIPSVLIFNHFAMLIVWAALSCSSSKLHKKVSLGMLMRLVNVYWATRFRHPGWVLADVRSSSGEVVKVKL